MKTIISVDFKSIINNEMVHNVVFLLTQYYVYNIEKMEYLAFSIVLLDLKLPLDLKSKYRTRIL